MIRFSFTRQHDISLQFFCRLARLRLEVYNAHPHRVRHRLAVLQHQLVLTTSSQYDQYILSCDPFALLKQCSSIAQCTKLVLRAIAPACVVHIASTGRGHNCWQELFRGIFEKTIEVNQRMATAAKWKKHNQWRPAMMVDLLDKGLISVYFVPASLTAKVVPFGIGKKGADTIITCDTACILSVLLASNARQHIGLHWQDWQDSRPPCRVSNYHANTSKDQSVVAYICFDPMLFSYSLYTTRPPKNPDVANACFQTLCDTAAVRLQRFETAQIA